MFTRRQLLVTGLAAGLAGVAGCSAKPSQPTVGGNGRPFKEFGIASDPWKAADWAKAVGVKPTMVMEFEAWERNRGLDTHFKAAQDAKMSSYSITWEPWATVDSSLGVDAKSKVQPKYSNQAIADGQLDAYIKTFATSVKDSKLTVYIRYAHEMNGNWYPWSHDPAAFVKAWQHIVDVFRSVGATNAKFIFAPAENLYQTDDQWLAGVTGYWPGDTYADLVGTTMVDLGKSKSYTVAQFVPRLELLHTTFNKEAFLPEVNSAASDRVSFFTDLRTWLGDPASDWVHGMVLSQLPSRAEAERGNSVGDLSWQVTNDAEAKPIIKALVQDIT